MKNSDIIKPWAVDPMAERWGWARHYLAESGYPKKIWRQPDPDTIEDQVEKIMEWLLGRRNSVVCFCKSPHYMRNLYVYLAASWAFTTESSVSIFDFKDLIEMTYEKKERENEVESSGLLILPFVGEEPGVRKLFRGLFITLLQRRRMAGLATITDVLVDKKPKGPEGYDEEVGHLADLYGDLAYDLFSTDVSKYVYVNVPGKDEE